MAVDFDYAMAERFGLDLNHNGLIDLPNTAQYAQPATFSATFTVEDDPSPDPSTLYRWSMQPAAGPAVVVERTAAQIAIDPPVVSVAQGVYPTTFQRIVGGGVTDQVQKNVSIRDILVVGLGDSYSSGEANPERLQGIALPGLFPVSTSYLEQSDLNQDLPGAAFTLSLPFLSQTAEAVWADGADGFYGPTPNGVNMNEENRQAHRSTLAATPRYALALEKADPHTSVTFVFVSQSGATTQTAIGKAVNPGRENPSYPLPDQVAELAAIVGARPIDQMFVSLGANDVGFADIARQLLEIDLVADILGEIASFFPSQYSQIIQQVIQALGQSAAVAAAVQTFRTNAAALPARYGQVQQYLASNGITSAATFQMQYPDPTSILKSFSIPGTGRSFTLPWWGPAIFDIIPGVGVSATESFFISQFIINPLDTLVARGAAANGWTAITDIPQAFVGHGYDAPRAADSPGNLRFIRTARESVIYQGPLGLTSPGTTSGTLHPNGLGHQAIQAAITSAVTPTVALAVGPGGRLAAALPRGPRRAGNRGLTVSWDLDRLPGEGRFKADVVGRRVVVDGPGRVATLRVSNALGVVSERAVYLSPRGRARAGAR